MALPPALAKHLSLPLIAAPMTGVSSLDLVFECCSRGVAGGVSDGTALLCAEVLGADLAYMGTKFIATGESAASTAYKRAVADASIDDVETSRVKTGLPANFLHSWLDSAGLTVADAAAPAGFDFATVANSHDEWAAGHSVHGVGEIVSVAELIDRTRNEYDAAKSSVQLLGGSR
jgi:nitronate monooxygenase